MVRTGVVKKLFSVPSVASKRVKYWLTGKACKIIKNEKTIATGERHYGLYTLNMIIIYANICCKNISIIMSFIILMITSSVKGVF